MRPVVDRAMLGAYAGVLPVCAQERCPAAQGSAGHRGRYPIDLFLPRETTRIRIWIEEDYLT
jgi:hypothetical protein